MLCSRILILLALIGSFLILTSPAQAGWGEDALRREANYISDSSFTEQAYHHAGVMPAAAAYGAINDVRIHQDGPDWVRPGESAVAAIGLMDASRQLRSAGWDTKRYDAVLSRFFRAWLLRSRQGWDTDPKDGDYGGMARRVFYDRAGHWQRDEAYSAGTTGVTVVALWKYSEYLAETGRAADAAQWRRDAWAIARPAGDYLRRSSDPRYHLIRGNASSGDLWTSDSVYTADALRCLSRWAKTTGVLPAYNYNALANQLTLGIQAMQDTGPRRNFFTFRDSRAGYAPTYGGWIDQLGFLPYEADALPPNSAFARQVSDWWTNGDGGDSIRMTAQTDNPRDWRFYGLHWHFYFQPRPENAYLYPGPDLQLAVMEWKTGTALHDPVLLGRAQRRYEWANKAEYSNLWLGDGSQTEAGVGNGLVDWRDGSNYTHKADDWQRFVDTSAYFIQATLMIVYHTDTKFTPE